MEVASKINWVDVLVLIVVLRISYVALHDGFSHEIFPLIGTTCTGIICYSYYNTVSVYLSGRLESLLKSAPKIPSAAWNFIAFLLLVIVVGLSFKFLRALVDKLVKVTWHPFVESIGGLICGILRASVVLSVVLVFISLIKLPYLNHSINERSLTGGYFLRIVPDISGKVSWLLPKSGAGEAVLK